MNKTFIREFDKVLTSLVKSVEEYPLLPKFILLLCAQIFIFSFVAIAYLLDLIFVWGASKK